MTYNRGSGTSINGQILWEELQECRYGYCLLHTIYTIACLRQRYPRSCILLAKYDFKLAYQCLHYHWRMAIQCITVHNDLAYLALQLTFGGAPCLSEWGNILEHIVDLATILVADA